MKGILKFLIGLAVGGALGWAAGFLRLPMIEDANAFWVGFLACLVAVAGLVSLAFVVNNRRVIACLLARRDRSQVGRSPQAFVVVSVLLALLVGLAGSLGAWRLYQGNAELQSFLAKKDQKIAQQREMLTSARRSEQGTLLTNLLNRLDTALLAAPGAPLSPALRARVAAVSYACAPYRYVAGDDTLSPRELSPQRGALLLSLATMSLDSASFQWLKDSVTFAGADLAGANLRRLDLRNVNLRGANLKNADLRHADLSGADLEGADLWGAQLDSARLQGSNLRRSNLSWAELNAADLRLAKLNGATLAHAKVRRAQLSGATLQWVKAENALFNGANLAQVDLLGATLKRANFSRADLREANLMAAELEEMRLDQALVDGLACGQDLMEKLKDWRVAEAADLQANYKVVRDDSAGRYVSAVYHLEKIK